MRDLWFKGIVVLLLAVAAAALVLHSENGHYQFVRSGDQDLVIDTRTGDLWTEEGMHFQPTKGKITTARPMVDGQPSSAASHP